MILFPNAKINLGLDILRKRADGYHDIDTVMYPVPWCDILEIVPSRQDTTSLTVTGRAVGCPEEKNLVMRAYRAIEKEAGSIPPVDIFLHKVIPDGAGLGGGSSDAAFTLKALNDMFNLGFTQEKLEHIASGIGADCPFFIRNTPAFASGTGTTLEHIDIEWPRQFDIAIIKPEISVNTRQAYSAVKPGIPEHPLREIVSGNDTKNILPLIKNDFEASVFPVFPEISYIKERLLSLDSIKASYAAMSGSGSAVFALCDKSTGSDKLAEIISSEFPDASTFAAPLG